MPVRALLHCPSENTSENSAQSAAIFTPKADYILSEWSSPFAEEPKEGVQATGAKNLLRVENSSGVGKCERG